MTLEPTVMDYKAANKLWPYWTPDERKRWVACAAWSELYRMCAEAAEGDHFAAARRAVTVSVLNAVDCEDTTYPKRLETNP